jgi:hypothetical protein
MTITPRENLRGVIRRLAPGRVVPHVVDPAEQSFTLREDPAKESATSH